MDVGGTIPRKESVELSREQRPRITSGTVIETTINLQSFDLHTEINKFYL